MAHFTCRVYKIKIMKSLKKIEDFDAMIEAQCEMAEDVIEWIGKLQKDYRSEDIPEMVKEYLNRFIETWGKKEAKNENN